MTDVLAGGSADRPPRRWPMVAAAVVAAALVVGGGLQHLRGGSLDTSPAAVPSAGALPPSVPSSPELPSPGWTAWAPGDDPVPQPSGVTAAGIISGVRLVVGGPHPAGLGAGAPKLGGLPVPADWEVQQVWAVPAGLLAVVQRLHMSDTEPSSKIYLVRPDGTAVLLAAGDAFVARFDGKAIFALRSGATGPGSSADHPGVLSEVSLSGRVLDRHQVSAQFYPRADTSYGLLAEVYPPGDGPVDLQLLDRRTLAVRRHVGMAGYGFGATSTRVAWITAGCTTACRLVVADLRTGSQRTVAAASGYQPGEIAVSPDGRQVAVSYYGRHPQQPGGAAPGIVDVIDLTNGHRQRIPGVATGIKQAADLSWTPDGRWLAVGVGCPTGDYRRFGLWPAAGGPVHVLPGRYAGGYLSGALLAL